MAKLHRSFNYKFENNLKASKLNIDGRIWLDYGKEVAFYKPLKDDDFYIKFWDEKGTPEENVEYVTVKNNWIVIHFGGNYLTYYKCLCIRALMNSYKGGEF